MESADEAAPASATVGLALQQHDMVNRAGRNQGGRFVVAERVSVVSDNDDFIGIYSFRKKESTPARQARKAAEKNKAARRSLVENSESENQRSSRRRNSALQENTRRPNKKPAPGQQPRCRFADG
jgi:hypothetical protein